MLGGEKRLEENEGEHSENDSLRHCRILSIAQDIVFFCQRRKLFDP